MKDEMFSMLVAKTKTDKEYLTNLVSMKSIKQIKENKMNKKQFESYVKNITRKILTEKKMDSTLARKMMDGKAPLPKCPKCKKTLRFDMMKVLRCNNSQCDEYGLTSDVAQPIDNLKNDVEENQIALKNLSNEIKIASNIICSKGSEKDVEKTYKLLKKVHSELDEMFPQIANIKKLNKKIMRKN
jgi:hypothetical protein